MSAVFSSGNKTGKTFVWILALIFFIVGFLSISEKSKNETGKLSADSADGTYRPVLDSAGVFSEAELKNLESFISELDERTGIQIAVVVAKDLGGEDIESFSIRYAEQYKLGQKGADNGVLLTVAMKERKARIETGYGAEGILTDAACARIIRNKITPAFKQGKYSEGIEMAVKAIASVLTSDGEPAGNLTQTENSAEEDKESPFSLLAFVLLAAFVFILLGRGRMLWILPFIFGGGNSGRRNSDNFRKGGGGSFGGGGASGRW